MHYYQKHIGDFNNHTRHLSRVERSIYSDLIELYYQTERALIKDFDRLARLILAIDDEEKKALEFVLKEFFEERKDGYFNKRCEEEIFSYKNKKTSAKHAAEKRWCKNNDLQDATALKAHCELNANGMLTKNHKPRTINHKPRTQHLNTPWQTLPGVGWVCR